MCFLLSVTWSVGFGLHDGQGSTRVLCNVISEMRFIFKQCWFYFHLIPGKTDLIPEQKG